MALNAILTLIAALSRKVDSYSYPCFFCWGFPITCKSLCEMIYKFSDASDVAVRGAIEGTERPRLFVQVRDFLTLKGKRGSSINRI